MFDHAELKSYKKATEYREDNGPVLKCTVEERQREEAELRNVYVMFINPLISVTVTGERAIDQATFKRLNNILNITTRELNRFSGHLRQFIVDDKGVVFSHVIRRETTNRRTPIDIACYPKGQQLRTILINKNK